MVNDDGYGGSGDKSNDGVHEDQEQYGVAGVVVVVDQDGVVVVVFVDGDDDNDIMPTTTTTIMMSMSTKLFY